ncbi:helix-turn-helix transcriptional regulator [Aeribacillus pallidus]|jgi:DNA-binding XRE family transcriptional regulator|uniref:helix-turn-helix transcriptional regulator n=1 Tax=Aeribacillus pallidus TaxID=33936 RepID=UPI001DC6AF87|nr:helix-turn-helix domain-containing protein [Bacillus sp. (in: firmicutes)]
MTRDEIILLISEKLKLIRTEANYTQDKMAEIIGISKKTLVQIEKGRIEASWTVVIAVCAIFRESTIVQNTLGGDPLEVIETVVREGIDYRKEKTLGGKVWWREIERKNGYVLQQNVISQHYRILDDENYRIYSSFSKEGAFKRLDELVLDERKE